MLDKRVERPYTRAELERAITDLGYSVILPDGGIATRVEHLPGALALAGKDPEKIAEVKARLKADAEAIARDLAEAEAAEKAALDEQKKPAAKPAK